MFPWMQCSFRCLWLTNLRQKSKKIHDLKWLHASVALCAALIFKSMMFSHVRSCPTLTFYLARLPLKKIYQFWCHPLSATTAYCGFNPFMHSYSNTVSFIMHGLVATVACHVHLFRGHLLNHFLINVKIKMAARSAAKHRHQGVSL